MNWYLWRPILAKIATLYEIETHWSIDDLADAHEVLDVKYNIEQIEYDKLKNKK